MCMVMGLVEENFTPEKFADGPKRAFINVGIRKQEDGTFVS